MNTLFMSSNLVLSGNQVLIGLCGIAALIFGGIFLTKKYFHQQSEKLLFSKNTDHSSTLLRKHDEVDIMTHQTSIKLVGWVASLGIMVVVFAWTTCKTEYTLANFFSAPEEVDIEVPPTALDQPKPIPPTAVVAPPPPGQKLDFVVDDTKPETAKENTGESDSPTPSDYTGPTDNNSTVYTPTYVKEPVIVEPEPIDEPPVVAPDQMPRFPGCEDMAGDNNAKKMCADKSLLAFIYANIQYPAAARELGIEGMAIISFVVGKDGSITDMQIVKDPGGGCGKEALRVVKKMNDLAQKWTPGKQRGKTVKVRYTLPVRFKLNG